jgi:Ras family protein T1
LKKSTKFIGSSVFLPDSEESKTALVNDLCLAYFDYPLYSLFDEQKQVLRGVAENAFKRIFWLLDADKDGVLNEKEWNAFQVCSVCVMIFIVVIQKQCFDVQYEDDELVNLLGLSDKGELKSGIAVEEFLILMRELVKHHQQVDVWSVLRNIEEMKVEDTTTLSQTGMKLLMKLFQQFDKDKDGLLSKSEIEAAFSIVSDGNSFSKISQDYLSMAETTNDKLTSNGWISLWWYVFIFSIR